MRSSHRTGKRIISILFLGMIRDSDCAHGVRRVIIFTCLDLLTRKPLSKQR